MIRWIFLVLFLITASLKADPVKSGSDLFFQEKYLTLLKGKNVGLITNQTGVNADLRTTIDLLQEAAKDFRFVALFAPEHGLSGALYAGSFVPNQMEHEIRCYSLYGDTRRPTSDMLKDIDVLIYDIQEVGCRSYTYATTLYYVMEEAAKRNIEVIVLDRPNPMGGLIVDGPMLQEKFRSFVGYINIPYCHGMTIGELALFFNNEYKIGCRLKVIPMEGWKRDLLFKDTKLPWVPTSPHIPEPTTPLFYPATGIIGELGIVSNGVGYTLPFKIIGAPWIQGKQLAFVLNQQKISGVEFFPFTFQPYHGLYKGEKCEGVLIMVHNPKIFRPVTTGYLILGILKTLYPKEVADRLAKLKDSQRSMFNKVNGNDKIFQLLMETKCVAWQLASIDQEERKLFLKKRKQYLLY